MTSITSSMRSRGPADAVAELRVHGDRRVFCAEACSIRDGFVYVIGRRRSRWGADLSEVRWSDERAYSWAACEVRRIRWLEHELAGLDDSAEAVSFP
jgi:hypothetical protein